MTTFDDYFCNKNYFLSKKPRVDFKTQDESLILVEKSLSSIVSKTKTKVHDNVTYKVDSKNIVIGEKPFNIFLEKEFPAVVKRECKSYSCDLNSDVSWFRISRSHFLPLQEINVSNYCENLENESYFNKLELCEDQFSLGSLKDSRNNLKEIVLVPNASAFESKKTLSSSVSSLAKFNYLSGNTSSFTSDYSSLKHLCDSGRQSMISTKKQRKKRRIVFCCVG